MNAKWAQIRLATRFRLFAFIFGVVMIASALLAFAMSWEASKQVQRANVIAQVIRHYEQLEDVGQRLRDRSDFGVTLTAAEAHGLRNEISATAGKIRLAISEEVAIVGSSGAAEEAEEIALIDAIETNIRESAERRVPPRWAELIQEGISEETRELNAISRNMRIAGTTIRTVLLVEAVLAALFIALLLSWVTRQVMNPLRQLTSGAAALAAGQAGHRILPHGDPAIEAAMQTFNRMADQLEEQRDGIKQANEALALTVEQRTAELELSNHRLGELMARRGGFLADISHELRTPIAIIRGEADVVLRNRQSTREDMAESLRRVSGQADTVAKLVDDLLYVARNENGAPAIKSVKTNLVALVKSAVADVRFLLEADGGMIDFESSEKQAFILGDPTRIAQLLRILIDNAIQYSSGPPLITLGLMRSTAGYAISVSDQGIGIAPFEMAEIFERYRRGGKASDVNGNGNGLGLPLAKAIVEAHGGTISIESQDGKGTTVHVAFPDARPLKAIA